MSNMAKSEKVLKKMMRNPLLFKNILLSLHPQNRTRGLSVPEVTDFASELNKQIIV